jgi:hypothetical protein
VATSRRRGAWSQKLLSETTRACSRLVHSAATTASDPSGFALSAPRPCLYNTDISVSSSSSHARQNRLRKVASVSTEPLDPSSQITASNFTYIRVV